MSDTRGEANLTGAALGSRRLAQLCIRGLVTMSVLFIVVCRLPLAERELHVAGRYVSTADRRNRKRTTGGCRQDTKVGRLWTKL